jgi:pinin
VRNHNGDGDVDMGGGGGGSRGGGGGGGGGGKTDRPTAESVDEFTKKRGRRMFAGLLGTLKQSAREEKKHSAVTAQRRTIVEQAEERARETSEMLYKQAKGASTKKRAREEEAKARLDLRCAEKELELLDCTYEERKENHGDCLRTKEGNNPCVFYKPRSHTEATTASLERAKAELEDWRETQSGSLREKVERLRTIAADKARELEEAEAEAEGGDDDDEDGEIGGRGGGGRGEGDVRMDEEEAGGGGVEEEEAEEGEVLPAGARRGGGGGALKKEEDDDDDDDIMGDIEEAADPEGLEEMLGK